MANPITTKRIKSQEAIALLQSGTSHGLLHCFLQATLMQVVTDNNTAKNREFGSSVFLKRGGKTTRRL
jgi:hypothetical protein